MVFPLAPWPPRHSGVSIRYYPVIKHLVTRHTVDIFVHGELRAEVPEDPLLESLDRFVIEYNNTQPPCFTDRLLTLTEAFSPFGHPYRFAKYHAGALHVRLR